MNRARLIANPTSGANRAAELLPGLVTRLRTIAADLDVALTNSAGETMQSAARAAADGCEAVFVAGGDGTINAALRGLLANDRRAAIPVGVIPLGTGNDFAKALDLGEDADAARAIWTQHFENFDLAEPFDRIREALEESRKAA